MGSRGEKGERGYPGDDGRRGEKVDCLHYFCRFRIFLSKIAIHICLIKEVRSASEVKRGKKSVPITDYFILK